MISPATTAPLGRPASVPAHAPVPPGAPAAPGTPAAPGAPAPDAPTGGDDERYLDPEVVRERVEAGRRAEHEHGEPDPAVAAAGAPSYFASYAETAEQMHALAARYPELVEVVDIGDSGEKARGEADRDVLLLRLTAKGINEGSKPSAMHLGGEHAREIANPALLMRFAEELAAGYGTDPEATALLQTRVVDLVPMMNPDGHAVVEAGYAERDSGKLWQRKNTTPPAGTDLNRNYAFNWGGRGASSNPRSQTYRGASAASEPEVQAIQGHVAATTPGIFIDWHSYSRLNLFPWGDTREPTPDHESFFALAKKFSSFNGYTPKQSIGLYPTSGTSKDHVYGKHRIPAFTVETGDSFHQSDTAFEATWRENAPVLRYATKVADAPFERVHGPDALDVLVTHQGAPGVGAGESLVSATVSDATSGAAAVAAAELVTDPFAAPGTGIPLEAADGAFDSDTEQVRASVDAARLGAGLVYVRAQDADGNWGPATAQFAQEATTR